jgi:exopolyphosphatase/guanosine-5'-triphosphate,3'-diphosphate pyrophosphatase
VLSVSDVLAACDDLLHMTREQRAALPYMHPGRVDVIGAGALVWRCIVERVADEAGLTDVVTSEHDILDGIALSIA